MEQQAESPYSWFMDSRFNDSFGGKYNHSANLDAYAQHDDLLVPEGGDNLIKDIGGATHSMVFTVIKNTGNNDIIMKFTDAGGSSTSGYKWYLGVNEIWATSIAGAWIKFYAYGVDGHSKVSLFVGLKSESG